MTGEDRRRSLLIVGFGNALMGDDGIGPAVIEELTLQDLPESVGCRQLSDVLHLPTIWSGEDDVWLVDAVIAGAPPGTIHRFDHEETLGLAQGHETAHHLGLTEGLQWVLHAHPELRGVRFRLLGIEPEAVLPVETLSHAAEKAVRLLTEEVSASILRRR